MSEFISTNLPSLIKKGVPPNLAEQAIEILDAQNRGELPAPLEGEDLHIVRSAFAWMTAQQENNSKQ
ncbi:MAG: hypothetical protein ICV63_00525 [Coleofasciculus sp. Co-bin14]|nr:hypothetical protein [Coleofasciculus sp. Co-bin14]